MRSQAGGSAQASIFPSCCLNAATFAELRGLRGRVSACDQAMRAQCREHRGNGRSRLGVGRRAARRSGDRRLLRADDFGAADAQLHPGNAANRPGAATPAGVCRIRQRPGEHAGNRCDEAPPPARPRRQRAALPRPRARRARPQRPGLADRGRRRRSLAADGLDDGVQRRVDPPQRLPWSSRCSAAVSISACPALVARTSAAASSPPAANTGAAAHPSATILTARCATGLLA